MKYFLTGLLLLVLLSVKAQVKVSNDTLHWNSNRPLSWNDFKGQPEEGGTLKGQILCLNLGGFQRQSAHHQIHFNIVSVFDRMNSWMPVKDRTDAGLNYFQVMFNIYEVHARKMREAYALSRTSTNPDAEFQEKYSHSANDRSAELEQFKTETKLGMDTTALVTWRLKVDEELKALEAYGQ
ncbi:MAG: hypothetical protein K9J17_12250 [Flavobacteriales bacterium]|nr:hypothetical protein [Flavobacteriales bacterium]